MPQTLSLCLIARDEEALIGDCLESVGDLVDEMLVVDTGSTDATIEVATRAGAVVVEEPWQDDFSAARNQALDRATGDWVLSLDADERLVGDGVQQIRQALEAGGFDEGLLPIYPAATTDEPISSVLARGPSSSIVRLFRRHDRVRWVGRVHERVVRNVPARRRVIPAPILHLGNVVGYRDQRGKNERNRSLLERQCDEHPRDARALAFLVVEYLREHKLDEASDAARRAWDIHRTQTEDAPRPMLTLLLTGWTDLLLFRGELDHALSVLEQARSWGCDHPNLDYLTARTLNIQSQGLEPPEREHHLSHAYRCLQRAVDKNGLPYSEESLPGVTSWMAQELQGDVMLQLGRLDEALAHYDAAIAQQASCQGAQHGRVETLLAQGKALPALTELQTLLAPDNGEGWLLAALASQALGQPADVQRYLLLAHKNRQTLAPHRARMLIRLLRT